MQPLPLFAAAMLASSLCAAQDGTITGTVLAEWGFGKGEVRWDGTLSLSAGKLTNIEPYSFDPSPKVDRYFARQRRWTSLTIGQTDGLTLDVEAPGNAVLTFDTKPGKFAISLADLVSRSPVSFEAANGNRLVLTYRKALALNRLRIGDAQVEDDYPTVALGPAGEVTVAWLRFEDGADRIMAGTAVGNALENPVALSPAPGDNFRPRAAALADGATWVVWPSRVDGNWDLYARPIRDGRPGELVRLSRAPGPDLHCTAIAAGNTLWVFWQGWRNDSFDILCRTFTAGNWSPEAAVTASAGSDWEPAAAVGPQGQVTCVWDTYRHGSYDVYARMWREGKWGEEVPVVSTPDFEAHASVVYDAEGKAWVVWENGGPNWGKDSTKAGLHAKRALQWRCLVGGEVREPPAELATALGGKHAQQSESGQLSRDGDGRLWLTFRHMVAGGVWAAFAASYGEEGWTTAAMLPDSKGRQDQRLGLATDANGPPWAAWETDNRTRNVPLNSDVLIAQLVAPASAPASPKPGAAITVTPAEIPPDPARPRRATFADDKRLLLIGDLHRHTDLSVCQTGRDGSMADLYRYALDAARLDFITVTDHIQHIKVPSAYERWRTEKMADMYFVPRRLTPLFAYERSQRFPYGHRNVISPTRGQLLIPRTESNRPTSANRGYEGEVRIDPPGLWQRLTGTNPNQVTIPHTSGTKVMGQDWQFANPQFEPVVELYQGCRESYEYPGAPDPTKPKSATNEVGSIRAALAKGIRLGFIASSDHLATHNSYACVYAREHTRQAIVDAIRERRTFAATDTLGVQFSVGGHPLGSEFTAEAANAPLIVVNVLGMLPLKQVDLIKDNTVIHSRQPGERHARFTFLDADAKPGTSYYYVRVIQQDQMMAWGSPVWVTYR